MGKACQRPCYWVHTVCRIIQEEEEDQAGEVKGLRKIEELSKGVTELREEEE